MVEKNRKSSDMGFEAVLFENAQTKEAWDLFLA